MSHTLSQQPFFLAQHRYLALAIINALTAIVIVVMFMATAIDIPSEGNCTERVIDFHAVWGAARLALSGTMIAAFDQEVLQQAYLACDTDKLLYWLYPANMGLVLTPLGALDFLSAFIGFQLGSLALLALVARRYLKNDMTALIALVFAPAWLPALLVGQFTLLWCAGLLAAISAMRRDQHVIAGLLFGILTLKPTLGLLIPVILLADRRYLTFAAATATTIGLHTGAAAHYGFSYITRWIEAAHAHGASMIHGLADGNAMSSFAAFLPRFGLRVEFGVFANLGLVIAMAVIMFVVWRKHGAKSDQACALLCAAIPLSTPYLWHYDAGFTALTALFIYRLAEHDRGPVFWISLAILWAGAGITIWNTYFFHISAIYPTIVVPPILMMAFAFALLQLRTRQPSLHT
ncbi:MAG: glycosyltransferase family 87 protein [Pseudomonadota bacterium]